MTATVPDRARQLRPRASDQDEDAPPPPPPPIRNPEMVAPMAAYLASDDAWNINGYIFAVAGGSVSVLHHPTAQRTIWKPGLWTIDELIDVVPRDLLGDSQNPAPPPPDLDIPGRPAQVAAK
jgi:hypothetical protein